MHDSELFQDDLEADEKLKGRYIMLDRVDIHCIWVSRAILDLLPDPLPQVPGGEVVTEPGLGVFCDNAMDIVTSLWPKPSKEKKATALKNAIKELNKLGLVGMHDAGTLAEELRLFDEMANGADWTLRVYAMLECRKRNTYCPEEAVKFDRDDGLLIVKSVKLFAGMPR